MVLYFTESYCLRLIMWRKKIKIMIILFRKMYNILITFLQFPFSPVIQLLNSRRLYVAMNCCTVGLLLNPPEDLTAPKNNSRWSWLNLYVKMYLRESLCTTRFSNMETQDFIANKNPTNAVFLFVWPLISHLHFSDHIYKQLLC